LFFGTADEITRQNPPVEWRRARRRGEAKKDAVEFEYNGRKDEERNHKPDMPIFIFILNVLRSKYNGP